jgi:O-antigen/teichoic acid export membrane protein
MTQSLAAQTKLGVLYTTVGRFASAAVVFGGTVALARLLEVRDFGIVQICFMVVDLATKVGDFGFGAAIVQRREEVSREQVNTLFLVDLGLKVVFFVALMAARPGIAAYFAEPKVAEILPAIGIYMVVDCFSLPALTLLTRRLQFGAVARIDVIVRASEMILAIGLALSGMGLWSLVWSRILASSLSAVLACVAAGWAPGVSVDVRGSVPLLRFGGWLFVRNIAYYLAENVDYFVIGRVLGVRQVGFYSKAFEIMRMPQARVTRALNAVLFSAFSRLQDEPERVASGFRKAVLVTSLVSTPALIGLAVVAPEFVLLVLGEKWMPMVPPLQIMCFAGIVHAVDPHLVSVFTSVGQVRTAALRRIFELLTLSGGVLIGVRYGMNGVAAAVVVVSVFVTLATSRLLPRLRLRSWRDYLRPQMPALLAGGLMGAVTVMLRGYLVDRGVPAVVVLVTVVAAGIASFALALLVFRPRDVVALWTEGAGDMGRVRAWLKAKAGRI